MVRSNPSRKRLAREALELLGFRTTGESSLEELCNKLDLSPPLSSSTEFEIDAMRKRLSLLLKANKIREARKQLDMLRDQVAFLPWD